MHKGFTLIEILVVVTIMGLMVGGGIAAYTRFNDTQKVDQAARILVSDLRLVQKRADAGEKPDSGCTELDGYRIQGTMSTGNYLISAICDGGSVVGTQAKILPSQVVFTTNISMIFRSVARGVTGGGDITVRNELGTLTKVITVSSAGAISMQP